MHAMQKISHFYLEGLTRSKYGKNKGGNAEGSWPIRSILRQETKKVSL
jgi:hypothetical protein